MLQRVTVLIIQELKVSLCGERKTGFFPVHITSGCYFIQTGLLEYPFLSLINSDEEI